MTQATPAQQKAEREKHVKQGLHAGLGIVHASYQAAKFMKYKHGLVYFRDTTPHYLYQIGLQPPPRQHADDDDPQYPPIIRGHRRKP